MFQIINSTELAALQDGVGIEGSLGVVYQLRDTGDLYVWNPASQSMEGPFGSAVSSLVSADGISGATYDGLGRLTGYTRQGVAHVVSYPSGTAVVISNTTGAEREVTLDGDGRVQAIA